MEQIYYTQCPMGYGLGASNGFQVKRKSDQYPMSGDFRHLGMRAVVPGSRELAPPVLRYRRDGSSGEVAWLTPREREYETERGPWGRPGGHFAHGLRLTDDELAQLSWWPAGLFDAPFWCRRDPEPSRGKAPEPLEIGPALFLSPPNFEAVSTLGHGEDPEVLAHLLTALGSAMREDRTLFIIDEPGRLGRQFALLTFAFPEPWRGEITFSTYHDRPEDLPGFRLQGTTLAARPNRAALSALGIVADLTAGVFEPRVEPAEWAQRLARLFVGGDKVGRAAWERAAYLAARVRPIGSFWGEENLDPIFAFHEETRPSASIPRDGPAWTRLAERTDWAGRVGLAADWLVRGPSWWDNVRDQAASAEARSALLSHLALREAWRGSRNVASAWGTTAASWLGVAGPDEQSRALATALKGAPAPLRLAFLSSFLAELPAESAGSTLDRLRGVLGRESALLIPLDLRAAIEAHADASTIRPLVDRALSHADVLGDALDAMAEAAHSAGRVEPLAGEFADAVDDAEPAGRVAARNWALARADGEHWLRPHLRRLFAHASQVDRWRELRDACPDPFRPLLAGTVLEAARGPGMDPEAFRWGVEELLLPLPVARRPHEPAWPGAYLDLAPRGLEMVQRLYSKGRRNPELRAWIDAARERGELNEAQVERLRALRTMAQAVGSADFREMIASLPLVPHDDRGRWLALLLARIGPASTESLDVCLAHCASTWVGAFDAGSQGLTELARPLADRLRELSGRPEVWSDHLQRMIESLGIVRRSGRGWEPDGLAAEIIAATAGRAADPWPLRGFLLRHDGAWRALAVDARRSLAEGGLLSFESWDERLDADPIRKLELLFNACEPPTLRVSALRKMSDLGTLRTIGWWSADGGAADDIREAFARLVPLDPILHTEFRMAQGWMRPVTGTNRPGLSELGRDRWRCLEALSIFESEEFDEPARWAHLLADPGRLPLERLDAADRHRFAAWTIRLTGDFDAVPVERFAAWLAAKGIRDAEKVQDADRVLAGEAEADLMHRDGLADFSYRLRRELMALAGEARSRSSAATSSSSG